MFDVIAGSIRWNQLALMLCALAAIAVLYVTVLRPTSKRAKLELAAAKERTASVNAIQSLSQASAELLAHVLSRRSSSLSTQIEAIKSSLAAMPERLELQRSGAALVAAATRLEQALSQGGTSWPELEASKVVVACAKCSIQSESLVASRKSDA